jgi:hypothetical protein
LKSWAGHRYTYINEVQSPTASLSWANSAIRMRILPGKRVRGMIFLDIMPGRIEEDSDKWVTLPNEILKGEDLTWESVRCIQVRMGFTCNGPWTFVHPQSNRI